MPPKTRNLNRAAWIVIIYELQQAGALEGLSAPKVASMLPGIGDRTTVWRILQDAKTLASIMPELRARVGL